MQTRFLNASPTPMVGNAVKIVTPLLSNRPSQRVVSVTGRSTYAASLGRHLFGLGVPVHGTVAEKVTGGARFRPIDGAGDGGSAGTPAPAGIAACAAPGQTPAARPGLGSAPAARPAAAGTAAPRQPVAGLAGALGPTRPPPPLRLTRADLAPAIAGFLFTGTILMNLRPILSGIAWLAEAIGP